MFVHDRGKRHHEYAPGESVISSLTPDFVETIPQETADGVLYISIGYAVVIHRCCCGCGKEVVTRLSPNGWAITFDGESVSLNHSIGNSEFECRSHYWIRRNAVQWLPKFNSDQVALLNRIDPFDEDEQSVSAAGRQNSQPAVLARARECFRRLFTWKR